MRHYRGTRSAALVPEEVFGEIAGQYGYPINGDWQRARCAALTAACLELERVRRALPGGKARRLVCERFHGLHLGSAADGEARRLQLSPLTLWRAWVRWTRGKGESPAIFTWQVANCGRLPAVREDARD